MESWERSDKIEIHSASSIHSDHGYNTTPQHTPIRDSFFLLAHPLSRFGTATAGRLVQRGWPLGYLTLFTAWPDLGVLEPLCYLSRSRYPKGQHTPPDRRLSHALTHTHTVDRSACATRPPSGRRSRERRDASFGSKTLDPRRRGWWETPPKEVLASQASKGVAWVARESRTLRHSFASLLNPAENRPEETLPRERGSLSSGMTTHVALTFGESSFRRGPINRNCVIQRCTCVSSLLTGFRSWLDVGCSSVWNFLELDYEGRRAEDDFGVWTESLWDDWGWMNLWVCRSSVGKCVKN